MPHIAADSGSVLDLEAKILISDPKKGKNEIGFEELNTDSKQVFWSLISNISEEIFKPPHFGHKDQNFGSKSRVKVKQVWGIRPSVGYFQSLISNIRSDS